LTPKREVAGDVEASVEVVCSVCGDLFTMAATNVRKARKQGRPFVCRTCRHPPKPPDARMLAAMRMWWLDRVTLDKLPSWPPI
jgi:hypothetical protein